MGVLELAQGLLARRLGSLTLDAGPPTQDAVGHEAAVDQIRDACRDRIGAVVNTPRGSRSSRRTTPRSSLWTVELRREDPVMVPCRSRRRNRRGQRFLRQDARGWAGSRSAPTGATSGLLVRRACSQRNRRHDVRRTERGGVECPHGALAACRRCERITPSALPPHAAGPPDADGHTHTRRRHQASVTDAWCPRRRDVGADGRSGRPIST